MMDIMENEVLGPAIRNGILKGEATILASQLADWFGTLPEWVTERLANAEEAELIAWGKRVRSDQNLDDIFKG